MADEYAYSFVTIFVHPFAKKKQNLSFCSRPFLFILFVVTVIIPFIIIITIYLTIDNYFDILGIEISTQKNREKTISNKTGEIYGFLNEMPTRDLTP